MVTTLTVDDAQDIVWDALAVQHISDHRWYTKQLIVFERAGALLGFYYLKPLTEMQEGGDVFAAVPVPVFPVRSRDITVAVYEPAPAQDDAPCSGSGYAHKAHGQCPGYSTDRT